MIEIEIEVRCSPESHPSGARPIDDRSALLRRRSGCAPPRGLLAGAAEATVAAAGVDEGHLAVVLVSSDEIQNLNREHRGLDRPTDVLSFPVDEAGPAAGPRELGDVVICPEHTEDLIEAVVHGVLHLCGYDHESDSGEMLAVQDRVIEGLR